MKKNFYFTSISLLLFLYANSVSAQQIYLKATTFTEFAGPKGDFDQYAEITSMQLGAAAEYAPEANEGNGAVSPPLFNNIVITKNVDISSSKFMKLMAAKGSIADMEIVSVITTPNGPQVAHKVEFKGVFFTDISFSTVKGCTANCPGIAESYKIVFRAIRITTFTVNKGQVVANAPFMYNVASGESTF